MKNVTTPRTLSDATFTTGYQSVRNTSKGPRSNWLAWSGWIAFAVLLLSNAGGRA